MTRDIQLALTRSPVEAVEADIVVAGVFCDDRPLRGAAGRLDWRLCGQLSDLMASGTLDQAPGSAVLLPGSGPIKATRVLLLGLGQRREFSLERAQEAMRSAIDRCLSLRQDVIALSPLGIAPDDFARHAEVVVEGLTRAVREFGAAEDASGARELWLKICLSEKQFHEAEENLPALIAAHSDPRIHLKGQARPAARPVIPSVGEVAEAEEFHPDPS
ncbi:MAG: M17 family peptidase N-terminal domain-containing protein [Myxococcota bacterium]|nr:hypothetical protein [Spirochaeta sp.]RPG12170.1 MAG: hypothetical protein CBC32_003870 [Proteobacteria bacterium TMED72]